MTKQEFLIVQCKGVEKWTEGCEQTEESYKDWLNNVGFLGCSFCSVFSCDYFFGSYKRGSNCPLDDGECADEFNEMDVLDGMVNFDIFIKNANLLLTRIKNLKYNPEWKDINE